MQGGALERRRQTGNGLPPPLFARLKETQRIAEGIELGERREKRKKQIRTYVTVAATFGKWYHITAKLSLGDVALEIRPWSPLMRLIL